VDNAIKATDQGYVRLNIYLGEIDQAAPKRSVIRFDVEDTGRGIAADSVDEILKSWVNGPPQNRPACGNGTLGLAMTKQLVKYLGGELALKSEVGKGTTFSLAIPVGLNIEEEARLDTTAVAETCKIKPIQPAQIEFSGTALVAEDSKTNQLLAKLLLEQMGLEVTVVEDGRQAVEQALADEFDIIFMDIEMPRMNGYEATSALRAKGLTTPIVALTAHAMDGDDKKCYAAGCSDYLTKPIDRKMLGQILHKYLSRRQEGQGEKIDSTGPPASEPVRHFSKPSISEADSQTECPVDWQSLLDMCGDEDVIRQTTQMFLSDGPRCIISIRNAIKASNPKHVRMYAHGLKAAAQQVSATRLAEKAYHLECAAREKDLGSVPLIFEEVRQEYENLTSFLSKANWMEIAKQQCTNEQ